MELIKYTPAPTIKEFIKTYRPGELFYNWIVGPVGPLSGDSEFLTPAGWKRIDAYIPGDLVAQWEPDGEKLRFVEPDGYIVGDADSLIHFRNKHSLSMVLSPNHRLVYYNDRGELCEAPAGYVAEHKSKRRIPTTFDPVDRPGVGLSEMMIRLAVAIHADGHFPKTSPGSTARADMCHIVIRKDRKKARLRLLLDACGVEYKEATYPQRPAETIFKFRSPYVGKRYDARWWGATGAELEVILGEMVYWDGLYEGRDTRFSTTSKADADFIQYAAHACGGRATVKSYNDPRNPEWASVYTVHVAAKGSVKATVYIGEGTQVESVPAPGRKQYCFKTSSTYFLARHNGRVFVTGNSGKTSGIFFKLIYMAGLQEPSPVDGVRRTRAVIIRNTAPQLKDTTLSSWGLWFKDGQAGDWRATEKNFTLRFAVVDNATGRVDPVECEVLFRPLDTPDDIARVLSLEVTFALIDEFVEIPKEIIEALSARCGRYPSMKDGGPTNFGMWGSSNPSTEDIWWYEYLHNNPHVEYVTAGQREDPDVRRMRRAMLGFDISRPNMLEDNIEVSNTTYFLQPDALGPQAENLENLRGGINYYKNLIIGKTKTWIKQFVNAEWGFSIAGQPVVGTFRPNDHISKAPLRFNPLLPLIVGTDPGLAGSAMIFMQLDFNGVLNVLGELVQTGYGAERMIKERLKPYLALRFPNARVIIAPDPAANSRGPSDERTVVNVFKKHYDVVIETNNRLPLRLDAIHHFTTNTWEVGPALQIDPRTCPVLIRALKGGWRWETKPKKADTLKDQVDDNAYSHPGDAFGYGCRYFHKKTEKEQRYGVAATKPFVPPRNFGAASYHAK